MPLASRSFVVVAPLGRACAGLGRGGGRKRRGGSQPQRALSSRRFMVESRLATPATAPILEESSPRGTRFMH